MAGNNHIDIRPNRDGQPRAYIVGTRIRVQDVYFQSEVHGQTPDEIVDAFPHLTLAQVHAALAYYFDHQDEVQQEIREDEVFVESLKAKMGPGPLPEKLQGMEAAGDSVSSG